MIKHKTQKERIESLLSRISKGESFESASDLTTADFLSFVQELVSKNIQIEQLEKELMLSQEEVIKLQSDRTDYQDSISTLFETQRVSEAIQSSREPEAVISVMITFLEDMIEPEVYDFYTNENDLFNPEMTERFSSGSLAATISNLKEEGILDWAVSEANPIVVPDIDKLKKDGESSLVIIPLSSNQISAGVLVLKMNKPADYFSGNDIRVLSVLANHAAIAIENIWLYKKTERTKNFLENLIESSPLPIIVTTSKDKIKFFNPSARELLGLSSEDLKGRRLANIIEGGRSAVKEFREKISVEGRVVGARVNLKDMNGTLHPVSLTISEFFAEDNTTRDYLWMCENLREKIALEEERMKSEKLKVLYNTFISLNHEINNPLTIMNGNLKLMGTLLSSDDDKIQELLEAALRAGKRIEEVTAKLSRVNKVEYSQYDESTKMLNLDQ